MIWLERNSQQQARMKYLEAHIPRKWKLTSKMRRCNVITQARQACLLPAAASAPQPAASQHGEMKPSQGLSHTSPRPSLWAGQGGSGKSRLLQAAPFSGRTAGHAEDGAWVPPRYCVCLQPSVTPQKTGLLTVPGREDPDSGCECAQTLAVVADGGAGSEDGSGHRPDPGCRERPVL